MSLPVPDFWLPSIGQVGPGGFWWMIPSKSDLRTSKDGNCWLWKGFKYKGCLHLNCFTKHDQFFQDYFLIPEEIVKDRSLKGAFTVFFAGLPNRVIRRFQSLPVVWPLNSKKGHRENPCNDARNLTHDLFAGHIGKWAPEMMCLGEIGPLQGRNIRLMEEIRLTSWYGECPII